MRLFLSLCLVSAFLSVGAQDINVEYDKKRDLSGYKTFQMGEGEVITPKDRRQESPASLHKWVQGAIIVELTEKGLQKVDSAGDLVVSYVVGSQERTDFAQLGPLGTMPGNDSQTWSRDYQMGSLIIDLDDKNKNLIWRVNAITTASGTDIKNLIDQVVSAGFRKFSLKPKKVKKKK